MRNSPHTIQLLRTVSKAIINDPNEATKFSLAHRQRKHEPNNLTRYIAVQVIQQYINFMLHIMVTLLQIYNTLKVRRLYYTIRL